LDALVMLNAAIDQDAAELSIVATTLGVDEDALGVIAHLGAMPLLHACRRRFAAAVAPGWAEGCCPICGAWPTLAESRGLERARRLRCARCGGDWGTVAFRCPFCANTDHRQLGSLVPEAGGEARRVETCDRCRGYVKSVATLRAWAADEVALADLASIDLDLAAVERGYARPGAPAVDLGLRIVPAGADGADG
jgi:FdhE protein